MPDNISLPMDAELLVPHRPPLCLVNRLIDFSGQTGLVEAIIGPDNIFLNRDGALPSVILAELIAQASAAVKGYFDLIQGKDIKKGFLVDIREIHFTGRCLVGDVLNIRVEIIRTISGFSVVTGEVTRERDVLARGTLKIWVPDETDARD